MPFYSTWGFPTRYIASNWRHHTVYMFTTFGNWVQFLVLKIRNDMSNSVSRALFSLHNLVRNIRRGIEHAEFVCSWMIKQANHGSQNVAIRILRHRFRLNWHGLWQIGSHLVVDSPAAEESCWTASGTLVRCCQLLTVQRPRIFLVRCCRFLTVTLRRSFF